MQLDGRQKENEMSGRKQHEDHEFSVGYTEHEEPFLETPGKGTNKSGLRGEVWTGL